MLSLAEKLDFVPALLSVILTVAWAIVSGLWRSSAHPPTFLLHVGYAAFRKATARLSVAQMQAVLPPSNRIYERYVRRSRIAPDTVTLPHGALGHWIGSRKASSASSTDVKVLVWFHGGGFALPANIGYFHFFERLIADAQRTGKSLAVFSLTYTLAPQATYPTQLRQAVEAVRYVLDQDYAPAQILLGGDSAGGNLVGGVLSHLAHTHPAIAPVLLPNDAPLAGAVMIAPWVSMNTDYTGEEIDSRGDLITPAVAGPWASAYLGTATRDFYTDLSTAPTEWYAKFPVEKVLVCAGGSEILLPIIKEFVEKFSQGFERVEFCIGEREGHVAPIYNLHLGDQTETAQGKRVKSWLREVL
ncbi:lipase/thioesterase family protein [Aspergillus steynii IBT 23096]|uniref:Lipase/thioesterase family protein n=1 Tax=Aspergillus steynii IBT 23096 TaxID=1392250 RepID=A0A2I2G6Q4_9EURO|nr:lipase/thioesterase family protein [Aspergillus steynii IBT 23096]PLB48549.1 lipase/thioesterase family protein [Aspergillus steynii IBT 23096]